MFVAGQGAKSDNDPAARFFKRFDLKRNVGELRRKAQVSSLEFAQFVYRGLQRGYIRPPTTEELSAAVEEASAAKNDVMTYRLANAAVAHGLGAEFEGQLGVLRHD